MFTFSPTLEIFFEYMLWSIPPSRQLKGIHRSGPKANEREVLL